MKILYITISLILFLSLNYRSKAQDTLYFLVDTINIPKEQRIVKIQKNTAFTIDYEFFCKCINPYLNNLSFSYINHKKSPKEKIVDKKPNYKYLTWEELVALVQKIQTFFYVNNILYITEVLPGNKYKTNKVELAITRMPGGDGEIIKPPK